MTPIPLSRQKIEENFRRFEDVIVKAVSYYPQRTLVCSLKNSDITLPYRIKEALNYCLKENWSSFLDYERAQDIRNNFDAYVEDDCIFLGPKPNKKFKPDGLFNPAGTQSSEVTLKLPSQDLIEKMVRLLHDRNLSKITILGFPDRSFLRSLPKTYNVAVFFEHEVCTII